MIALGPRSNKADRPDHRYHYDLGRFGVELGQQQPVMRQDLLQKPLDAYAKKVQNGIRFKLSPAVPAFIPPKPQRPSAGLPGLLSNHLSIPSISASYTQLRDFTVDTAIWSLLSSQLQLFFWVLLKLAPWILLFTVISERMICVLRLDLVSPYTSFARCHSVASNLSPPYPTIPPPSYHDAIDSITSLAERIKRLENSQRSSTSLDEGMIARVLELETHQVSHLSVDKTVQSALLTYSKDGSGQRDFALHSGGAQPILWLSSPTRGLRTLSLWARWVNWLRGMDLSFVRINPISVALEAGVSVGDCWEFEGRSGHLGIRLSERVRVSTLAVDHAPRELLSNESITQAPKQIRLWGLLDGDFTASRYLHRAGDNLAPVERFLRTDLAADAQDLEDMEASHGFLQLADFVYDIHSPHASQTFPILNRLLGENLSFSVVVFEFLDNWGANSTCVYRTRIHNVG